MGFLKYNYGNAKIFMGDTGSLVIGFMMAFFGMKLLLVNAASPEYFSNIFVVVFALFLLPVFDALRLLIFRVVTGRSPYKAGQNHTHHWFLKLGYTHRRASRKLYAMHIAVIVSSFVLSRIIRQNQYFFYS